MSPLRLFPLCSLLAICATAQERIAPDFYAASEGNGASAWPFSAAAFRLQQLHGDQRGRPMTVQSLSFRRDGVTDSLLPIARTVELELAMAPCTAGQASLQFASNDGGLGTVVMDRRQLQLPDRVPLPGRIPAPFDVSLVLDRSFVFDGTRDLLFDLRVFSSTAPAGQHYFSDAAIPSDVVPGAHLVRGRGCQTDPFNPLQIMRLSATAWVDLGAQLTLAWFCVDAPLSASSAVVLVGARNPDLVIPSLCSTKLYTDATLVFTPEAPVNAIGAFRTPAFTLPWNATFAGQSLHAQAVTPDARQGGLPIAASNGLSTILPPGLPPVLHVQMVAASSPTAAVGYGVFDGGLIVRFGL